MTRKKKKLRRSVAITKYLLLSVIFTAALIFLATSSLFNIKAITVNGCTRYNEKEIIGISGIITGQNAFKMIGTNPLDILRLRFRSSEKIVEDKCSYIKNIKIRLRGMSSVVIEITERQPAAVIQHLGSGLVIDREGDVLEMASGNSVSKLLAIKGLEFDKYQIGKPLQLKKPEALVTAFELADTIKQADENEKDKLFSLLGWIDVGDQSKVLILLDNRITVNLGDLDDLNYMLDATRLIFKDNIKKEDKGMLDFTAGDNPVYKPE